MLILINVKQIGKRKQVIEKKPIELNPVPATTSELIAAVVLQQVEAFNNRLAESELLKYISQEQIQEKAEVGKIGFDVNYNGKEAKGSEAVINALQAFEDGIFRVFVGDTELETLAQPIQLKENDELTFIRLTFLAGRMW
ncbi:hypothetical protein M2459_000439 [Parabacteroides sp. PF5-5]|uniref:hypothetical protein n=1 Tax=unclassified Parabacteroides TaxID=2649774 RepID=UPI0024771A9B|nr:MULTISPECIES: hypothetical protein [unclassified Parabacteroides]MDH6303627.1 hypothetical protein [Parabacteroides sp. PH5-39]MDH6314949.1 hypothetical protein [Parabacteroides sp. PF5-13]MDH6318286.1 hypothetical protein [Parabacteroides sp. PH5-13]MDH6321781.1 hypothetical protein [Parabacteroides sp. PH5-8]MDH6325905.1 hypothetical protein [Parabacteroides sp. PH5-41]